MLSYNKIKINSFPTVRFQIRFSCPQEGKDPRCKGGHFSWGQHRHMFGLSAVAPPMASAVGSDPNSLLLKGVRTASLWSWWRAEPGAFRLCACGMVGAWPDSHCIKTDILQQTVKAIAQNQLELRYQTSLPKSVLGFPCQGWTSSI